ncbi:MAG: hypothetical protein KGI71_06540 [Patescibacteria group bacterium]|nr:hypothetical protein [Patescibacteria group bacterium]
MSADTKIAELEHALALQKLMIAKLSFELARRDGVQAEADVARTKAALDALQRAGSVEDAHA